MSEKPTIIDLYLWRTKFSPVLQQLKGSCSTEECNSLTPSMIPDKKGCCSKINMSANSCLEKSLSKDAINMDVFSEKETYLIKCFKKSLEKLNYYPSVGSNYINESASDTSISERYKKINRNHGSSNLPDGAFISLDELHSAIRKLKPVNHSSDYLPLKEQQPYIDVPKIESRSRTPCFVELVSIFPRRSDVPDGAFISLAELGAAIQHLRPLKVRSCEDRFRNITKPNRVTHPVITSDMLQEAMSRLKHVDEPNIQIILPSPTSVLNTKANNKQKLTQQRKSKAIKSIVNPLVTIVDKKGDSNRMMEVVNEQPKKRDRCSVITDHNEDEEPTTSFFSFMCCVRVKVSTKK